MKRIRMLGLVVILLALATFIATAAPSMASPVPAEADATYAVGFVSDRVDPPLERGFQGVRAISSLTLLAAAIIAAPALRHRWAGALVGTGIVGARAGWCYRTRQSGPRWDCGNRRSPTTMVGTLVQ